MTTDNAEVRESKETRFDVGTTINRQCSVLFDLVKRGAVPPKFVDILYMEQFAQIYSIIDVLYGSLKVCNICQCNKNKRVNAFFMYVRMCVYLIGSII